MDVKFTKYLRKSVRLFLGTIYLQNRKIVKNSIRKLA